MRRVLAAKGPAWSNPFGGEAGAFHFAVLTAVAFAAVAIADVTAGATAALLVWALVTFAALAFVIGGNRPSRVLPTVPLRVTPADGRRLVVLAQATPPAERLDELARAADRVVVVSAAATAGVRWLTSDDDEARSRADCRVRETVRKLRDAHVDAIGMVGDDDPVRAVENALRAFGGDAIVVATGSGASEAAVAGRVREHVALPLTHVVA